MTATQIDFTKLSPAELANLFAAYTAQQTASKAASDASVATFASEFIADALASNIEEKTLMNGVGHRVAGEITVGERKLSYTFRAVWSDTVKPRAPKGSAVTVTTVEADADEAGE